MLRRFVSLASFVAVLLPLAAHAQSSADSTALRQTALDYAEGYYAADGDRVARALHPALRKRMVYTHPQTAADSLNRQDFQTLVAGTRRGGGADVPEERRQTDVQILDIYKDAASVRVTMHGWVDYLHVVKWRGDWKIINVLWELKQQPTASR